MTNAGLPGADAGGARLDASSFARVSRIAMSAAGLNIPQSKLTMVQSRLSRRLKSTGHGDFSSYLDFVENAGKETELEHFVSALTTNVSHFFRENHHFETFRKDVLPELLQRARKGGRVRIWSAGCSTGQEPYSIAISLLQADANCAELDIRILASDIDQKVLLAAKAGRYDDRQIGGVPGDLLSRYFRSVSEAGSQTFTVSEGVRRLISFRQLNLMANWPMNGTFDVIFCRNVVIYFSEETQATLWPRFRAVLASGGWLFLGHSERIHDPKQNGFDVVGITSYRRNDDPALTKSH